MRAGRELVGLGALGLLLAACGSSSIAGSNPPYASPRSSPPSVVMQRVCNKQTASDKTADTQFIQILLIRQGTDLGRVSDDLTGAVPGGNFATDSGLALRDAKDTKSLVDTSRLCDPLKGKLSAAAQDLVSADNALANTGGGDSASAALQDAQSKYQALSSLVNNPPSA
jgi:hypothetical protein